MSQTNARRFSDGYKYVGDLLNISYITGFVRSPTKNGFLIQQNNNIELSIPVAVSAGTRIPDEYQPVTVLCHVFGVLRDDGTRGTVLKAIDIRQPSTRAMPTEIAWNSVLPAKAKTDDFRPFSRSQTYREEILTKLDADDDALRQEEIVRTILSASKGHLDTRLGENSNVVMLAGFVQSAAIVRPTEHQKGYLAVMLRQHEDKSKSVPIRIYGSILNDLKKSITLGQPIKVVGRAFTKLVLNPETLEIADRVLYVRAHDMHHAAPKTDIRRTPIWMSSMVEEIQKLREERRQAMMKNAEARVEAEASKSAKVAEPSSSEFA